MSIAEYFSSITQSKLGQSLLVGSVLIGVFKITTFSLSVVSLVFDLFILPATNYSKYGAKKGNWAVITGASDGLGKEYALQLAAKGLNIVLISRTQSKLELLATDIESKYKVSTKIIAFDASTDEDENYLKISNAIDGLPVTVLINNVGQSHSIPVPFVETELKELTDIVTINNLVTLKITQTVLPVIKQTLNQDKKIRGLILTMGSFGGLFPTAYLATYSGSKAFLQNWSNALAGELAPEKIDVELVLSYLVTSAMSKIKRPSLLIPNAKNFVKSAINSVGYRGGAQERFATNTPYWTHALMHFAVANSVGIYSKIANTINFNMHKSIRVRALKKAARLANEKKD
ncbi:beta-hydroxysteroid dehydrogenase type 3 [Hyphopichia burtonii NRRL Y-1933]|uniref:Very-long-chain 3-oxoacyl-CoA reductase n=1 Tax=Hyphopichia burtonii NRRL Y-1933 TaxID=984485 RepID=A0A1E4RKZ0_9ASCO|nr:beta-hydroxysteroid dehydrogenase type 3 [Hyphopichia burtonii NRRL Y-1933]ODV67755.1 beta-hydroxysteroid dehydrogenase type 3 [Hyphopichia burtonii NRRL Y-1933]